MRIKVEPRAVRGTGRTHAQLTDAPIDAFFICPNSGMVQHARDIARKIGRSDIRVVGPYSLEQDGMVLRGRGRRVVVDHACDLTEAETATLSELNCMAR